MIGTKENSFGTGEVMEEESPPSQQLLQPPQPLSQQPQQPPQLVSRLLRHEQQHESAVEAAPDISPEALDTLADLQRDKSPWLFYKDKVQWCLNITGFSPTFVQALINEVEIKAGPRRGPTPKLSIADGIFITLCLYHSGLPHSELASLLRVKVDPLVSAIGRVLLPLSSVLEMLQATLVAQYRPVPLVPPLELTGVPEGTGPGQMLRNIGILIDSTPFRKPDPRGTIGHEASKHYWNGHNGFYADKAEVAVMAAPPYLAITWTPLHIGSESDITIHREDGAKRISAWLKMSDAEADTCKVPHGSFWGALYDSGYLGQAATMFPRAIIQKYSSSLPALDEEIRNFYYSSRVHVEQFFGRLKKVFKMSAKVYNGEMQRKQIDVNNMLILCNLHILQGQLAGFEFGKYYRKWVQSVNNEIDTRKKKHRLTTASWRARVQTIIDAEDPGLSRPTVRLRLSVAESAVTILRSMGYTIQSPAQPQQQQQQIQQQQQQQQQSPPQPTHSPPAQLAQLPTQSPPLVGPLAGMSNFANIAHSQQQTQYEQDLHKTIHQSTEPTAAASTAAGEKFQYQQDMEAALLASMQHSSVNIFCQHDDIEDLPTPPSENHPPTPSENHPPAPPPEPHITV